MNARLPDGVKQSRRAHESRGRFRLGRASVALVLVGLALALAALLYWWPRGSASPQESAAASLDDVSAAAELASVADQGERTARAPEDRPHDAAPTITISAAPSPQLATLIIHLRRASDESALVGAAVTVSSDRDEQPVRTDEHGDARFEFESTVRVRGLHVDATESTPAVTRFVDLRCVIGAQLETTLRIESGATLSGRVVDGAGGAVANATVDVWSTKSYPSRESPDRSVSTDSAGRFTVAHVGSDFFVAARTASMCCKSGLKGSAAGRGSIDGLEVVLAPCAPISGHVVDDRGVPLSGVDLELWGASGSVDYRPTDVTGVQSVRWGAAQALTGADGAFRIEGLADDELQRTAWVEHAEALGVYAQLDPRTADNRITLERGVELSGVVVRPDGSPAEGADVWLGFTRGKARKVKTDTEGRFVARGLARQPDSIVRVHHAGDALWVDEHVEFAPNRDPLLIRLEPARALAGRVVDERGRAVPHAAVTIRGDRELHLQARFGEPTTWEWSFSLHESTCDALGHFRFDDLYDGAFELTARDSREPERTGKLTARSGSTEIELRLGADSGVSIVGRVFDAQTRAPIRAFDVTPMLQDEGGKTWTGRASSFESADGRFGIGGLRPGAIELVVSAPGYSRWSAGQREYAAGEQRIEVPLLATRELRLRLVDARGAPLDSSARATFETLDGQALQVELAPGTYTGGMQLHGEPQRIAGLPASIVRVLVTPVGLLDPLVVEFDLTAPLEGVQDIVVVLPTMRRLSLYVFTVANDASSWTAIDEHLRPPASAEPPASAVTVRLLDARGRALSDGSITPSDGAFEVVARRGSGWAQFTTEDAQITLEDPGAAKLEVQANDCDTLTVDLESQPSGELRQLVLLRRR